MRITFLVAASALTLLAACGQPQQTANTSAAAPPATPAPVLPPAPTPITAMDFTDKAAKSDAFELQAASLALTRSQRADVKAFARMMRTDHTATARELAALASANNLTPRANLDSDQQAELDALGAASGTAFDTLYLDQQVKAHTDAVDLFSQFSENGSPDALKQWAATTLPELRMHLERAQALQNAT